jgi:hypothetical protein
MGDLCEALRLGKVLSNHNKQVQVARETTLGGHWDDVKLQQRHEITSAAPSAIARDQFFTSRPSEARIADMPNRRLTMPSEHAIVGDRGQQHGV